MAEGKRYGFFHDAKGNLSSKRLMALICLIVGILLAVAWVIIIVKVPPLDRATIPSFKELILIFIGSALTLQGISFGQELFSPKQKEETPKEVKPNVTT